jgi:hypothetical protein
MMAQEDPDLMYIMEEDLAVPEAPMVRDIMEMEGDKKNSIKGKAAKRQTAA